MTGGMANMIDGRALAAEERRVLGIVWLLWPSKAAKFAWTPS